MISAYKPAKFQGRLFIVVDGQPYYRSSGVNSGLEGTWLPFIMCKSSFKQDCSSLDVPEHFVLQSWKKVFGNDQAYIPGYIIKYSLYIIKSNYFDLDISVLNEILAKSVKDNPEKSNNRITRKQHLITSARLGGGMWNDKKIEGRIFQALLNDMEIEQAKIKIDVDVENFSRVYDPDSLNLWLIRNGASDVYDFALLNEESNKFMTTTVLGDLNNLYSRLVSFARDSDSIKLLEPIDQLRNKIKEKLNHVILNENFDFNNHVLIRIIKDTIAFILSVFGNKTDFHLSERERKKIRNYSADTISILDRNPHKLFHKKLNDKLFPDLKADFFVAMKI